MTQKVFTVGQLIKSLQESGLDPDTPVFASGIHARPITKLTISTLGDPATGRVGGDPKGPPVVIME